MLTKIKEFLFGKPTQLETAAPYKIEAVPLGTEATMAAATPAELKVVAEMADAIHDTGKPVKTPAKPRATPKPAAAKPKAPRAPRAPK
jgi:hypothetical protein